MIGFVRLREAGKVSFRRIGWSFHAFCPGVGGVSHRSLHTHRNAAVRPAKFPWTAVIDCLLHGKYEKHLTQKDVKNFPCAHPEGILGWKCKSTVSWLWH